MVKDLNKVYKENYKHKHTLKYIREVVESCIDSKFRFEIDDIYKTFSLKDDMGRLGSDFYLNAEDKKDLDRVGNKVSPSYTVNLKREDDLYTDCELDDYIYLLECMKKADAEFSKKGLKLSPNTIDNEMDFDIIEMDNVFKLTKDNANVNDFLDDVQYRYASNQSRNYNMHLDEKAFYRTYLTNGYNATNEAENIENIEHFEKFLRKECKKEGFVCVEVKDYKFNIYTKRQHRMLKLKEVLK